MPAQRAQSLADIAREMVDACASELVPRSLSCLFDAAKPDQRLPPRFARRHAGAPVLLDLLLDMKTDLVVESVVEVPSAEE